MIGLSTSYYATKGLSVYDSVFKTVNLGFNVVELGAAHTFEDNVWDTLHKIKKDFPKIIFTIHTLFPPLSKRIWFNPADGLNAINKKVIDNLFESAQIVEARLISIHPPMLNEISLKEKVKGNFDRPEAGKPKNKSVSKKNFIELLRYADKKARSLGIKLLIENMDTSSFKIFPSSKRDFLEIFDKFPNTGLLLDIGHALQAGNICEMSELKSDIFEVHLHDTVNSFERGNWAHLPIKDLSYFEALKGILNKNPLFFIFEHGADVSEDDIFKEKELLQQFLFNYTTGKRS